MAGLCVGGLGIYPSGYTAPPHRPALNKAPILAEPAAYNRPIVPTALAAKRHITMATPGLKWPSPIVKMDAWNNLKGPADHWQIMPKSANTFKELPSVNRQVEAADKPYSQSAAIKAIVATTTGGAIEPKKSILDIARSFVLTTINPAVKDWWARRVNSLDQLEAIAATRSLTHSETIIRDKILREITENSNKIDNLAIYAPAYVAPAAPAPAATSTTSTSTTSTSTTSTSTTSTSTTSTAIASPSAGSPGGSPILSSSTPVAAMPGGSPILSSSTPVAAMPGGSPSPALVPMSGPATPPLKSLTLHTPPTTPSGTLGPPTTPSGTLGTPPSSPTTTRSATGPTFQDYIGDTQPAGPGGVTVNINFNNTAAAFQNTMKQVYPTGFTESDGKVWRDPVALISESKQITKLGPVYIKNKPTDARDHVIDTMTTYKNCRKTAIAMQYCVELSPYGDYPQLKDFVNNPAELLKVFTESKNGKFAYNRGYTANFT